MTTIPYTALCRAGVIVLTDVATLQPVTIPGKWAPSLYFVVGQVGWFACVVSAAKGASWIGIVISLVFIALHLWRVERPIEEIKLLASVAFMGGVWESLLIASGLLEYPMSTLMHGLAPPWLPTLWGLFAAQINTTYQWLKNRLLLAVLLGAVAGPLSFRGGAALGALHFARPLPAALALAVGWAVLLPVVILLSRRWNGVGPQAKDLQTAPAG